MESLSRPLHRRKLSNTNVFSFSGVKQHPYDDVFKFGAPVNNVTAGAPNYSEIFGACSSSIPVLDLEDSRVYEDCYKSSSKLDYSSIFGGFCDDEDVAVPHDELFSKAKRGKRSGKNRAASEGSDQISPSERHKESSCEATNQSFDGPKNFNLSYHKTSQRSRDGSNGMTQIAQLHAVPGFTYFIDESSHLQKTEAFQRTPFVKSEAHRNCISGEIIKGGRDRGDLHVSKTQSSDEVLRNRSFSGEIFKGGYASNGDLHVPKKQSIDQSHRNRSFSGEIFKGGHASNGDLHVPKKQSFDRVHCNRSFSGEIFKEGHAMNGDLPVPKKQSSDNHRNRHFSGEIFKGRDRTGDLHVPKKQSSDVVHDDKNFSRELSSAHDRKENSHVTKKHSSDGAVKVTSGSSSDTFHIIDKFYSAHDEFDRRSSSTEGASTSSPMVNDIKGHPDQSKISVPDCRIGASARGVRATNTSPPTSDEELDANSAAAVSAATLKKAIEKAQESIRLAKELMERKKDGVPPSQKRRSKSSLKSKENRVECNTRSNRGNAEELHRKVGIGLPPFIEVGKGIPSSNGDFVSCFNLKEQEWVDGKIKLNTQSENVETSQGDIAGTWFPEVSISGKENRETLASQQVESNDVSQPSMENNRHVYKLNGMNTGNKNLELGEGPDDIKSMWVLKPILNLFRKAEAPEKYKDASDSARMHVSEEYAKKSEITNGYCFSKEGKCSGELKKPENMKDNRESRFDEKRSSENLQISPEPLTEEKVRVHEMKNDNQQKMPSGNENLTHGNSECRALEEVHEVKENKSRLRRSSDEEETEGMLKDAFVWVENDKKPQHGYGSEGTESRMDDFQGGQDTRKCSNEVCECALSENNMTYSHEGKESDRKREGCEREGLEEIPVEPCEFEPTEEIVNRADKFTQNRNTEASQEAEETDSWLEASDKSKDNMVSNVAQGGPDKQNSESANEPDNNSSPSSEIQETCGHQLENNDVGISQEAADFGGTQGVSEVVYENEEWQKDGVIEESSSSTETEILEAANDLQIANEEDTSEDKVQDTYEASSEDAKEVNRGSTCTNGVENRPSERVVFETERSCDVVHQNVSENELHFAPEVHSSEEPENTTFTEINIEQKCMEETAVDPESCSNVDEGDGSWVHGHGEDEETVKGDSIATDQVEKNKDVEAAQQEKNSIENSEELECSSSSGDCKDNEPLRDEEIKREIHEEESNLSQKTVIEEESQESLQKEVEDKNSSGKTEVDMRQREREKDRIAVERAIREARERAFAEARERAERAAVERATAEVRQRVMAEALEKREKPSVSNKVSTDKSSTEAKIKAERAAVERATAEARERALEKALSQKTTAELRSQADRHGVERFASATRENGLKHSLSSSDLEKFDGSNNESAQRRKARLERHQRIMERAANALVEKNKRDLLAQKEQTERNRLAEALDADIKRWASGNEGNLRALLSTLQYILGADSGWQPISLTEIIMTAAVKKAYRKATLYVHPDKGYWESPLNMTIFIFLLSLGGVFYSYNHGALFTALVVICALTSGIAGYTSASFYCQLEGTNWP